MDYHEDVSHTSDATLIHRVNAPAVIELIREKGPITRTEVVRALRLSLPTITRIISGAVFAYPSRVRVRLPFKKTKTSRS